MTFLILACALPSYKTANDHTMADQPDEPMDLTDLPPPSTSNMTLYWWPFFVVIFYILCPIPTMIARRYSNGTDGTSSSCMETAIFLTMGLLVSSFALPIVLARAAVIQWGACYLTIVGNIIVYLTILGFFTIFDMEDSDYAMW